jgi:hypothetical protein
LSEPRTATGDRIELAHGLILGASCVALAAYHWCKLETLVAGDNVRWFLEAYRESRGEVMYRDFSFLYGPMGIWVFAAAFRLLGPTFVALQFTIDVLSAALCLATWRLARRLLPPGPALAVGLLTALGGAGNAGNFALFSLSLYTPSLLTGLIGVLLFVLPLLDIAPDDDAPRPPVPSTRQGLLLATGGTLACLSKVEFAVAVVAGCAAALLLDLARRSTIDLGRAFTRQALLWSCALGPSLLVYAWLANWVGATNLIEALGGYGVGTHVCPWWPTGLGLICGAAAIGEAMLVVALASAPWASTLWRRHGWRYAVFLGVTVIGAGLFALQVPYALYDFRVSQGLPAAPSWRSDLGLLPTYLLSFNGVLLPVMWLGIAMFAARSLELVGAALGRTARTPRGSAHLPDRMLLLLAVVTGISLRGLFSGLFGDVSTVNQSAYPFLFVLAAWLPISAVRLAVSVPSPALERRLLGGVVIALVGYGVIRMGHRVHQMKAGGDYQALATEAGSVRVHESEVGPALYHWIVTATPEDARLLEIPWGGGLTFAAHRHSATFSTQFFGVSPSVRIQRTDLEQIEASPPDAVIARDRPDLGTGTGVGRGCSFPHFTFRPPKLAQNATPLPIVAQVLTYPAVLWAGAYVVRRPTAAPGAPSAVNVAP